ncbi:glutamate-cysteine ligase family protein [Streptomyces sp. NPDC003863]
MSWCPAAWIPGQGDEICFSQYVAASPPWITKGSLPTMTSPTLLSDGSAGRGPWRAPRPVMALGRAVMAAGAAPLARLGAVPATDEPPYHAMSETYRRVADEQLICVAQMHVDVPDRDSAVRAPCVINPRLPPLPALSASSPYRLGADTGHASRRSMIRQRRPTCGPRSTN